MIAISSHGNDFTCETGPDINFFLEKGFFFNCTERIFFIDDTDYSYTSMLFDLYAKVYIVEVQVGESGKKQYI